MLTIAIDSIEEHGCGIEGTLAAGRGAQARFTVCPVLGPYLVYNVDTWQLDPLELPD